MNKNYNIRELREARGISRADLVEITGVRYNFLARLETFRLKPSFKSIYKVAKFFKLDPQKTIDYYNKNYKPFHNGNYLRELRFDSGLPASEICYKTGIDKQAYYRMEQGQAQISEEQQKRLAIVFQVDFDEFSENLKVK